jgi:spore germination cell wall hydrolase CwlJ-like protein
MAKINYKIKQTQWANKSRLHFGTRIGLLILILSSVCLYFGAKVLREANDDTSEVVEDAITLDIYDYPKNDIEVLGEENFKCLVLNAYYEARGESREGITAVTMVVLNRSMHDFFPTKICDIIKQTKRDANGNIILNQCQFSWYCDGKSDYPQDNRAYGRVEYITQQAVEKWFNDNDISNGATHFHSTKVNPDWTNDFTRVATIGSHVFYKME